MILQDFECQTCGNIHEELVTADIKHTFCPECGEISKMIISPRDTAPVDSPWISGVREVVDKSGKKPWCNEFLRHPTRANLHKWMKGENLRHRDPAEPAFPKVDKKERRARIKKRVLKAWQERNTISI